MLINNRKYNLDEVSIIPAKTCSINTRNECNPTYIGKLPIFIAPMCTLVDDTNIDVFEKIGFNCIIPRTIDFDKRLRMLNYGVWTAFGLKESMYIAENPNVLTGDVINICVDQANGHMSSLLKVCKAIKQLSSPSLNIHIMAGNIANPLTCFDYAEAGIEYVRVGIGTGNVCTTSLQTGVHYPIAPLISECRSIIDSNPIDLKIVADGGFENISQIIKALGLGADYCMIGRIVASFEEACGPIIRNMSQTDMREYFGMSTNKAQILINGASLFKDETFVIKKSEGESIYVPIECTADEWVRSFESALRSTMSYTNAKTLNEFVGKCDFVVQNPYKLLSRNFKDF